MGETAALRTLDDMCRAMCDNVLPKEPKYWIFTFGCGREEYGDKAGTAVKVYANSYSEARKKMCDKYGYKWAFQYSAKEWKEFRDDPKRFWDMEEITEVIE